VSAPVSLPAYHVVAHNAATRSENKIHDDTVARQYGFEGGLVPGVTMYAWLMKTVVAALGPAWLERGTVAARFLKPCYEGDAVTIDGTLHRAPDGPTVLVEARRANGERTATATATLPSWPDAPPDPVAFPRASLPTERPRASEASLAPGTVLGSVDATVAAEQLGPGALLTLANTILTANVRLGPWIHTESVVTHFDAVRAGAHVEARGKVIRCFARKRHRLVELDVLLMADATRPVQRVQHTAIWEPARRD
jgi:acyl dehydratase